MPPADLVLLDGDIYTVDDDNPRARDMVITGNTITAVFNVDGEADKYIGENTRVIDLKGAFVTPGMIDGHVHYGRAGALINDANLMMVSDEEGLKKEISRVVELLDKDEWITEGLWGAYEQWAAGDTGETTTRKRKSWRPTRYMIDDLTPDNPVFSAGLITKNIWPIQPHSKRPGWTTVYIMVWSSTGTGNPQV